MTADRSHRMREQIDVERAMPYRSVRDFRGLLIAYLRARVSDGVWADALAYAVESERTTRPDNQDAA